MQVAQWLHLCKISQLDLKLQACLSPHYNILAEAICPRLFVFVYKYVLLLFIIAVVEYMFMPSFIFIRVSVGQLSA